MGNTLNELSELIYLGDSDNFFKHLSKVEFDLNGTTSTKLNLLHVAAKTENSRNIILKLIEKGANKNIQDENGETPLFYAANYNCPENLKQLMECGADPLISNHRLNTPIHVACSGNHIDCVRILITYGVDVNLPNGNNYTPLFMAVYAEADIELLELLLDNDADINAGNRSGTPLMAALSCENLELVKFLIEKGAKIKGITNSFGEDALNFAKRVGNLELVTYLEENI